ncbi:MAG: aceF [Hydrocarboniphaga sp.]|uniref:dihydrolipoyllysine-residue acetyltransferase n=1 Tax=Hydrocarboniphaga sp. TaxID=2033016 RepID=UPI002615E9C3|nr:dihydrolipoyllysine-residue acetyltransferase [Hydrocarboniphaga sp.]MDB5970538.1 aceF [Hydrocarboniphaga sp.]
MAKLEIKVPDIGDSSDVPVIELLVKVGDTVTREQSLIVLESEKATMEVPAPEAGVIRSLSIKVGDKVSKGTLIGEIETEAAAAAAPKVEPAAAKTPSPAPAGEPLAQAKTEDSRSELSQRRDGGAKSATAAPPSAPTQPSPASGGGQILEVKIPDIGDYQGVPVIEVLVKDGDTVTAEQALLVLETDKATMEVPSPGAGVVQGFRIKVGDKVSKGDVVCTLQGSSSGAKESAAPAASSPSPAPAGEGRDGGAKSATAAPSSAPTQPSTASGGGLSEETPQASSGKPGELPYAGPGTRKFARELGVDLTKVKGSGLRGRIVVEDVQGFVKQTLAQPAAVAAAPSGGSGIPPIPAVDFSLFGEIETTPLARIRKLSATHLHRAWVNIPHVTQTDDADITELEAFRKSASEETGTKLTLLPFVMKAVEKAMQAHPDFNTSLSPDGASLIKKKYLHIGFAADTPNGLVVPVVRDVDKKGIVQLANECAELASRARDGKLKPDEMKGGCFSISSLGGIGGSYFTPIVNAPEVAILGVSRGVMKPVWDGKAFQPRLMLPLSLSYDHRVIDGALGARFIVLLTRLLGDLRRLAL